MKICGFTIIKNAVINQYPVIEAIKSLLPIVDEMLVLAGDSDDATNQLITEIGSDKIKLHHSVWDKSITSGGTVLAVETNKAFDLISDSYDWVFYIQADEVVHQQDYTAILAAAEKYKNDHSIDGLLFKFMQFYATYDYIGDSRRWYHHEVRILKNNKKIRSYRDAQGFRKNNGEKLLVKPVDAYIYHYGWVKSPQQIITKQRNISQYWADATDNRSFDSEEFDFSEIDSLELFKGTHPEVMKERIAAMNWNIKLDISKKKFTIKDKLLYWVEKITGKRLFSFKNYKLV
jgi:hypothetical protein